MNKHYISFKVQDEEELRYIARYLDRSPNQVLTFKVDYTLLTVNLTCNDTQIRWLHHYITKVTTAGHYTQFTYLEDQDNYTDVIEVYGALDDNDIQDILN